MDHPAGLRRKLDRVSMSALLGHSCPAPPLPPAARNRMERGPQGSNVYLEPKHSTSAVPTWEDSVLLHGGEHEDFRFFNENRKRGRRKAPPRTLSDLDPWTTNFSHSAAIARGPIEHVHKAQHRFKGGGHHPKELNANRYFFDGDAVKALKVPSRGYTPETNIREVMYGGDQRVEDLGPDEKVQQPSRRINRRDPLYESQYDTSRNGQQQQPGLKRYASHLASDQVAAALVPGASQATVKKKYFGGKRPILNHFRSNQVSDALNHVSMSSKNVRNRQMQERRESWSSVPENMTSSHRHDN